MKAIVAVDRNWGIGYKGELLVSLPEDQKQVFRYYTLGHPIVYGRKTLLTFPGQKLLPGRDNLILSRNSDFAKEGAIVLHSVAELKDYQEKHKDNAIFIIGGEEVYKQLLPDCEEVIVSKIDYAFTADAFFPNLDQLEDWEKVAEEEPIDSIKGYRFSVCHYRRRK